MARSNLNASLLVSVVFLFAVMAITSSFMTSPLLAGSITPKPVQCDGQLFEGKAKYNEELSGVKCFGGKAGQASCFVVADEKKGLQQFSVYKSSAGNLACAIGPVLAKKRGLYCLPGKKPERDFEAIASDGRSLIITGSWGNRRKKSVAPSPERWALITQPLKGVSDIAGDCARVQRKDIMSLLKNAKGGFEHFADTPLQCGGLNVEGLAYQNGKLFFGLRSPSSFQAGGAWVITANAEPLFKGNLAAINAKREYLAFRVNKQPLVGVGIRGLEPVGKHQMLVVTGPAGVSSDSVNQDGRAYMNAKCAMQPYYQNAKTNLAYRIWLWTPKTGRLEDLGDVAGQYAGQKLESVSVISHEDNKVTLLMAFDGIDNAHMSPLAQAVISLR